MVVVAVVVVVVVKMLVTCCCISDRCYLVAVAQKMDFDCNSRDSAAGGNSVAYQAVDAH